MSANETWKDVAWIGRVEEVAGKFAGGPGEAVITAFYRQGGSRADALPGHGWTAALLEVEGDDHLFLYEYGTDDPEEPDRMGTVERKETFGIIVVEGEIVPHRAVCLPCKPGGLKAIRKRAEEIAWRAEEDGDTRIASPY